MKTLTEILDTPQKWLKGRSHDPSIPGSACLGYAIVVAKNAYGSDTDWKDVRAFRIIQSLFPERSQPSLSCHCNCYGSNITVHFNNHPDTTFEEIQKVCRVYDHEVEDQVPEEGY